METAVNSTTPKEGVSPSFVHKPALDPGASQLRRGAPSEPSILFLFLKGRLRFTHCSLARRHTACPRIGSFWKERTTDHVWSRSRSSVQAPRCRRAGDGRGSEEPAPSAERLPGRGAGQQPQSSGLAPREPRRDEDRGAPRVRAAGAGAARAESSGPSEYVCPAARGALKPSPPAKPRTAPLTVASTLSLQVSLLKKKEDDNNDTRTAIQATAWGPGAGWRQVYCPPGGREGHFTEPGTSPRLCSWGGDRGPIFLSH